MRSSTPPTIAPLTIQLSAGQSHYLWTGRNAVLLVQSGSIRLRESPEWMSETILRTLSTLQEGQHYQLGRSGWTCLYATHTAEILYYASATPPAFSLSAIAAALLAPARRVRNMAAQLLASR